MRIAATLMLFGSICVSTVALLPAEAQSEMADRIFRNGNIYTVNEPPATRRGGRRQRGESSSSARMPSRRSMEGPQTELVDLKGATVLPGLTDSHYHLSGVGLREMTLNLEGTTSLDEFLAKVKARVDQAKPASG